MVRTGKWANTLRKADVRTENAFSQVEAGKVQIIDGLRPAAQEPTPALYDVKACLCGLVNTWETMEKVPGHKAVGPTLAKNIG